MTRTGMMTLATRPHRATAIVAALSLLGPTLSAVQQKPTAAPAAQAPPKPTAPATAKPAAPATAKPAAPATAKPATAAAATTAEPPVDGGWPRKYLLPSGGSILVYQ